MFAKFPQGLLIVVSLTLVFFELFSQCVEFVGVEGVGPSGSRVEVFVSSVFIAVDWGVKTSWYPVQCLELVYDVLKVGDCVVLEVAEVTEFLVGLGDFEGVGV